MSQSTSDVGERFYDKVNERGENQCWEWQGAVTAGGYGCIRVNGSVEQAHRVSIVLHFEEIESINEINIARHTCDNKTCVNPNHLLTGDAKLNAQDMAERGRTSGQKLSVEDAREIRERYRNEDVFQKELAEEYGVSRSNITMVVNCESFEFID